MASPIDQTPLHDLKTEVALYITSRTATKKWKGGTTIENLAWITTEVGEAIDAHFREDAAWIRNHPGVSSNHEGLIKELADIVFMVFVTAYYIDPSIDIAAEVSAKMQSTRKVASND